MKKSNNCFNLTTLLSRFLQELEQKPRQLNALQVKQMLGGHRFAVQKII
jgi:hypothetical protein